MLKLIFKYIIPLVLMLAVFLVGYNYFWGTPEEKQQSKQIIGSNRPWSRRGRIVAAFIAKHADVDFAKLIESSVGDGLKQHDKSQYGFAYSANGADDFQQGAVVQSDDLKQLFMINSIDTFHRIAKENSGEFLSRWMPHADQFGADSIIGSLELNVVRA